MIWRKPAGAVRVAAAAGPGDSHAQSGSKRWSCCSCTMLPRLSRRADAGNGCFELAELMRGSERTGSSHHFRDRRRRDQHRLFKGYESGAVTSLQADRAHILQNKADVFFQLHRHKQQLARELREKTETLRLNEMLTPC